MSKIWISKKPLGIIIYLLSIGRELSPQNLFKEEKTTTLRWTESGKPVRKSTHYIIKNFLFFFNYEPEDSLQAIRTEMTSRFWLFNCTKDWHFTHKDSPKADWPNQLQAYKLELWVQNWFWKQEKYVNPIIQAMSLVPIAWSVCCVLRNESNYRLKEVLQTSDDKL